MHDYDLLVIGSGPAGEKAAAQAAYFGKLVAVVERALLGGTSVNTGTLPSKTLREASLALSGFRQRAFRAVAVNVDHALTIEDFVYRENYVRTVERARIARNLERHGIDVLAGDASFVDGHTLRVRGGEGGERLVSAEVIVIATGSRPFRPPEYPFDDPRVFDSDEITDLSRIPGALVVAGGGVIGSEYACLFAALGVRVTLVDRKPELLSFLDHEVVERLTRAMTEVLHIDLRLGRSVAKLELAEQGCVVHLDDGDEVRADAVLVASGRTANTDTLRLGTVGITPDARGQIAVDENYRTTCPSVYAVGDVIGFPALAATSMEQGRIAVVHAFDLKYKTALPPVLPYGIYTIPEVSMAGATEAELVAKGVPCTVGRAEFADNARGTIIGEQRGFLKLVFTEPDLRLAGVHVVGEQATELVHVGLTALLMGATAEVFIQTCFNHPTLAEAYKYATYDALGHRARE